MEPVAKGLHITHWSSEDLARQAVTEGIIGSISPRTVRLILDQVDLQPHRTRYWRTTWTSPRMAGAGLRVYAAISYSAGDLYPSDECRRTRLKKTSMYSNRLALACSLVANLSP